MPIPPKSWDFFILQLNIDPASASNITINCLGRLRCKISPVHSLSSTRKLYRKWDYRTSRNSRKSKIGGLRKCAKGRYRLWEQEPPKGTLWTVYECWFFPVKIRVCVYLWWRWATPVGKLTVKAYVLSRKGELCLLNSETRWKANSNILISYTSYNHLTHILPQQQVWVNRFWKYYIK